MFTKKAYLYLFIIILGCVAGCTTYRGVLVALPPAMTKNDIIDLSKAGVTDEIIIGKINSTYTVFYLSVEDILKLKNEGVSNKVIEYMRETEMHAREKASVAAERRRIEEQYRPYWWWETHHHPRRW